MFAIAIWFGAAFSREKSSRITEKIIGCNLPPFEDVYIIRTKRHTGKIISDTSHPANYLFHKLQSIKLPVNKNCTSL